MKRGRLPLTALRSFEAAGRLKSFTRAAEELFVSQAAISRQVRELEGELGIALFAREHRSVRLTEAGQALLLALTGAFDDISEVISSIAAGAGTPQVTVSAEPGFAAQWLVPELPSFHALHPDVDVTIESDTRLLEWKPGDTRLAVRHSSTATSWPRTQSRHLYSVSLVPVMAPSLAAGRPIEKPTDLLDFALLHEDSRSVWKEWFDAAGVGDAGQMRGSVLADCALVMQAALRGQGAALCDESFARSAIDAGDLIQPFGPTLALGSYFLVTRDFGSLPPGARLFADWLSSRFAGQK